MGGNLVQLLLALLADLSNLPFGLVIMDVKLYWALPGSLVRRPFPPPVLERLQYANIGGGNGLGTRLLPACPVCSLMH